MSILAHRFWAKRSRLSHVYEGSIKALQNGRFFRTYV